MSEVSPRPTHYLCRGGSSILGSGQESLTVIMASLPAKMRLALLSSVATLHIGSEIGLWKVQGHRKALRTVMWASVDRAESIPTVTTGVTSSFPNPNPKPNPNPNPSPNLNPNSNPNPNPNLSLTVTRNERHDVSSSPEEALHLNQNKEIPQRMPYVSVGVRRSELGKLSHSRLPSSSLISSLSSQTCLERRNAQGCGSSVQGYN